MMTGLVAATTMIATTAPAFCSGLNTRHIVPISADQLPIRYLSGSASRDYWAASSDYYVSTSTGATPARLGGPALRHVLITGYHPVEGFAPELAAEARAAGASETGLMR